MKFRFHEEQYEINGERKTLVRYSTLDDNFFVTAASTCVGVSGNLGLTNADEFEELETVLRWAFRQHESLKTTGQSINQDILTAELSA